ncbi:MAG: histidinol dehydrogenase [Candidatus Aminicenantes bacterium]|nr:histidinol dehydrogenase [Candidatus Aminicenantes bacterium]
MRRLRSSELDSSFFAVHEVEDVKVVCQIITDVKIRGDMALKEYTRKFDGVDIASFLVPAREISQARETSSQELVECLEAAASRIEKFAQKQFDKLQDFEIEMDRGIIAGQKIVPVERVGVYVPGGRYPLVSSVLMGAVPARVAGVKEIALFSPPSDNGEIAPGILAAAAVADIEEVYRLGGAQAVAAMAYGTQSVKPVHKIVGPGNIYVNAAKKLVYGRVGVDFIAGPTEILIIADKTANPSYVAADLIAQAEHDIEARPVLLSDSERFADDVMKEMDVQLQALKTAKTARQSLQKNGVVVVFDHAEEAVDIANRKAPEHLQLCVSNPEDFLPHLRNYGTLFVGEYASETLGDYSSGLNHILPTNAAARYTGGLSVKDFVKIQTILKVDQEGFRKIGPVAASIAHAEGLFGHEAAIRKRLDHLIGLG